MLYTVFTSFRARDNETGYIRLMHKTEKIEAPDKFTAKAHCMASHLRER